MILKPRRKSRDHEPPHRPQKSVGDEKWKKGRPDIGIVEDAQGKVPVVRKGGKINNHADRQIDDLPKQKYGPLLPATSREIKREGVTCQVNRSEDGTESGRFGHRSLSDWRALRLVEDFEYSECHRAHGAGQQKGDEFHGPRKRVDPSPGVWSANTGCHSHDRQENPEPQGQRLL